MNNKVVYLQTKLAELQSRYKENEQLWYELYLAANPNIPADAGVNGRKTQEVYSHTRDHISMELLFIQMELELIKMGGGSDIRKGE